MNRYEITLDKRSFLTWHREAQFASETSFSSQVPESGEVWNDVDEDIVIHGIFKEGEERTVECLTQYSEWVSMQE